MAVTNVDGPFPDLSLEEETIISVDAGDAAAVITSLVIHFTQDIPPLTVPLEPHLLAYAGWEAPVDDVA